MKVLLSIFAHPYLLIGCFIVCIPFYLVIGKAFFNGLSSTYNFFGSTDAEIADDSSMRIIFFFFICAGMATMLYKLAEHVFF